jgi:uncharacterized Zn finger protein
MDYPWWTINAAEWGFSEEEEIHCLSCAEESKQALVRELTDSEIEELGGVTCRICGRHWRATQEIVNTDAGDSFVTE